MNQILVVLSSEKTQHKECIKIPGWTEILHGDTSNLEDIWIQLSSKDEALVSFCHSSDHINDLSPQHILFTYWRFMSIMFITTNDREFRETYSTISPHCYILSRALVISH